MVTKRLAIQDQEEACLLLGQHDRNLKDLERRFAVQIFVRPNSLDNGGGMVLAVRGKARAAEQAISILTEMKQQALRQKGAARHDGRSSLSLSGRTDDASPSPATADTILTTVTGRHIRPQTKQQSAYVQLISKNDLVVAIGPAGTGKTYLAVASALAALQRGKVMRIILTRPVVEAGEKLGFLPGDFYEKVHPYLKPLYDAFYIMTGPDRFRQLRDEGTIEIVPLAYMRGRTLDDAFIILDEGQNTTPEQMKMFLTRMGSGSQSVITGDVTQIDLENKQHSGLIHATQILKGVPGIEMIQFSEQDVIRHGLVKRVIKAYEEWDKQKK
ncbi:MAG TPA: PhoH family protein [Elusimicrobiota bacterium]|nr:PhoH family protein [Elusimicrobiota bacterium]